MSLTTFILVIALAMAASFPVGLLIPQSPEDPLFDWIAGRYRRPETEESEMEQERRLR